MNFLTSQDLNAKRLKVGQEKCRPFDSSMWRAAPGGPARMKIRWEVGRCIYSANLALLYFVAVNGP